MKVFSIIHHKLPAVDRVFLNKLQIIDWLAIIHNLLSSDESREFTFAQAVLAILRYQLFLFLVRKYPQMRMVPSQEIDAVLHAHIATAQNYQEECQYLFDASLVHSPGLGTRGEADRQEWLLAFAQTRKLFEHNFGQGTMGYSVAACCEVLRVPT
ncbi:MAG: hypothetical protein F6K31_08545 [Symploca sp. SIO2G7]|nr:hypothetical protein [Symploca sp. SIO2G7]